MTMTSNNAPQVKWFRTVMACGTERHRLHIDTRETPYFVDVAHSVQHRHQGSKIGIYASGFGAEVRRRDGSSYRIAAFVGGFDKITSAKLRAEQIAMEMM